MLGREVLEGTASARNAALNFQGCGGQLPVLSASLPLTSTRVFFGNPTFYLL